MNDNSVLINGSDCQKVVLIPNQICSVPTGTILPTGNEGDIYQIVGGSVQAIPLPSSQFVVNPDGSATHTSADGTVTTLPAPAGGGNSSLETQLNGTILLSTDDGNTYTLDPSAAVVTTDAAGNVVVTPTNGAAVTLIPGVSTFIDNNDGTFTHTSADGTATTFSGGSSSVVSNPDGTVTVTGDDGNPVTFAPSTASTVVNPDGTVTVTADDGTIVTLGAVVSDSATTNNLRNLEHTAVDGTAHEYDPGQSGSVQLSALNSPVLVGDGGLFAFPSESWNRTISRIQLKSKTAGVAVDVTITHNGVSQVVTLPAGADYISVAGAGFGSISDTHWLEVEATAVGTGAPVNGLTATVEWE